MLDTIFVTEGETARTFHFSIAIDDQYPMQAAARCHDAAHRPAGREESAVGRRDRLAGPHRDPQRRPDRPSSDPRRRGRGVRDGERLRVRLLETEGRSKVFKLRLFRAPTSARQRDFRGHTVQTLQVDGDAVVVHIAPHEICEVEVTF